MERTIDKACFLIGCSGLVSQWREWCSGIQWLIELFHFAANLVEALFGRKDSDFDVVDDDLDHLDLFFEAGSRGEDAADGLLQLWSGVEEVFGGGGGDSNERHMVVVGEPDIWNECLGKGSIDWVVQQQGCDVLRDGRAISGDDEGVVAFGGCSRSVGGSSGGFGELGPFLEATRSEGRPFPGQLPS